MNELLWVIGGWVGEHVREAPAIAVKHRDDVEEDGVLGHAYSPTEDVGEAVEVSPAVVGDHAL